MLGSQSFEIKIDQVPSAQQEVCPNLFVLTQLVVHAYFEHV